jgi:hypothetical protein
VEAPNPIAVIMVPNATIEEHGGFRTSAVDTNSRHGSVLSRRTAGAGRQRNSADATSI